MNILHTVRSCLLSDRFQKRFLFIFGKIVNKAELIPVCIGELLCRIIGTYDYVQIICLV